MQLREMRYARIEGTEVLVEVKSPAEAKAAIKELKHKKKEIALLKKRMCASSSKRDAPSNAPRKQQNARHVAAG